MLRRINSVLPELVAELIVYGILVELVGVWFTEDKLRYTTGLWIGIAVAIGMAIHMAIVIEDSVSIAMESNGDKRIIAFSVLRYIVVVIVFFLVAVFHLGDIIICFIGVMGLKPCAYLQPFTHRFMERLRGDSKLSQKEHVD